MDHLVPMARGGTSTKGNVVTSCKPCNTEKGHKTAIDSAFEELKTRQQQVQLGEDSSALVPEGSSGDLADCTLSTEIS